MTTNGLGIRKLGMGNRITDDGVPQGSSMGPLLNY